MSILYWVYQFVFSHIQSMIHLLLHMWSDEWSSDVYMFLDCTKFTNLSFYVVLSMTDLLRIKHISAFNVFFFLSSQDTKLLCDHYVLPEHMRRCWKKCSVPHNYSLYYMHSVCDYGCLSASSHMDFCTKSLNPVLWSIVLDDLCLIIWKWTRQIW